MDAAVEQLLAEKKGEADRAAFNLAVREAVSDVIARQRSAGIDIVNEGEYTKGGDWLSYVESRFAGFEARPPSDKPVLLFFTRFVMEQLLARRGRVYAGAKAQRIFPAADVGDLYR